MKKRIIGDVVEFTFTGLDSYTFNTRLVHADNKARAVPVAFSHRLGDSAAGCKTEAERREAVVALGEHYLSGSPDWNTRTAVKSLNATWAAIAEKRNVSYEVVAAEMAQRDLDVLAAL